MVSRESGLRQRCQILQLFPQAVHALSLAWKPGINQNRAAGAKTTAVADFVPKIPSVQCRKDRQGCWPTALHTCPAVAQAFKVLLLRRLFCFGWPAGLGLM